MNWISVEDRLPDRMTTVLVNTVLNSVYIGEVVYLGGGNYQWNVYTPSGAIFYHGSNFCHITHWMPLPEPPKEDK